MTWSAGGAQRLRRGPDIVATMRGRSQRVGELLVLHARDAGTATPPRFAVIASRRVGGAVVRNRAKRLLREAVRSCPLKDGVDVVLVARPRISSASMGEVAEELRRLAAAQGILEGVAAS